MSFSPLFSYSDSRTGNDTRLIHIINPLKVFIIHITYIQEGISYRDRMSIVVVVLTTVDI